MKISHFLFLLFAIVVFGSCKKETVVRNSLIGDWELRSVYGGYTTPAPGPYKPIIKGNGSIYRFTKTELQKINKGAVYEKITYTIVKEEKT